MFLSGFSAIAAAIGIGQAQGMLCAPILPENKRPSQLRRHPSAANPRSKYRKAFQGEKERIRVHNAAGFQPVKVTPRPPEAFAYVGVPGLRSRQAERRMELVTGKRLRPR